MFKDSFKYYKSKCPPPDLTSVLDLDQDNIAGVSRIPVRCVDRDCRMYGVKSPSKWEVFGINQRPGLLFIRNPFTKHGQRYWIARCLRDFPKAPHAVNLSEKLFSKEAIDDWWTQLQLAEGDTKESSILKHGMRWATLGYHHDWDTKIYAEHKRHKFPDDLAQLSRYIAAVLGFPETYSAEAAIVNFYPLGTTLAGHTDHSEKNLDAPLFSFSFGQTAIFLLGGKTKEVKPAAMFLKSGDIVVMSKESRLSYHAVPKIVKTNVDWISEVIDNHADDSNDADSVWQKDADLDDYDVCQKKRKLASDTMDEILDINLWHQCQSQIFWKPFAEYIADCRININVRQVLHSGEKTL